MPADIGAEGKGPAATVGEIACSGRGAILSGAAAAGETTAGEKGEISRGECEEAAGIGREEEGEEGDDTGEGEAGGVWVCGEGVS